MAQQWEHGMMSINSDRGQLEFQTADGPADFQYDGVGLKTVAKALDDLSADGWELIGSPSFMQELDGSFALTTYVLRRPIRPKGEPQVW